MVTRHPGRPAAARARPVPFGLYLAAGSVLVVAGTLVAAAAFPADAPAARLAVLALVCCGFSGAVPDLRASAAVTLLGALCHLGFLVNRYGELRWHGAATTVQLSVLAAATLLGWGWRWLRWLRGAARFEAAYRDLVAADPTRARVPRPRA